MLKSNFTISALMSNKNGLPNLLDSLNTISNQTIPFDEIIIIDDFSNDKSVETILNFKNMNANLILFKNQQRTNLIQNYNFLAEKSSTDFIYFFSSSDSYDINIVSQFHRLMNKYPNVKMVCGKSVINDNKFYSQNFNYSLTNNENYLTKASFLKILDKSKFKFFAGGNIINRTEFIKLGLFQENIKWNADWLTYYIIAMNNSIIVCEKQFAQMNVNPNQYSSSRNNFQEQSKIILNIIEYLFGFEHKSFVYFKKYAILPTYEINLFYYLIIQRKFLKFITLRLLYYFLTYSLFKKIHSIVPHSYYKRLLKLLNY